MKKILIIQTAFAGDVVLTLPLIQTAHSMFSPCTIDVVCIPSTSALLANHPDVSNIITYDKKNDRYALKLFGEFGRLLRNHRYDIVISPHRSFRSALIAWKTRAKQRISFDTSAGKFLFTRTVNYNSVQHEIERVLSLLTVFKTDIPFDYRPRLYPGEEDIKHVDLFLEDQNISKRFICIAPGSVWNTKRWTIEGFSYVTLKLVEDGYTVFLIGGSSDAELCRYIMDKNDSSHCFNAADTFSFLESAEIIRRSALLISNDSAPVHLATAMETPVVDIYGATSPSFGFAPYGVDHRIVQKEGLSCKPCSIHGGDVCPIKSFVCMNDLSWTEIYRAARELLQEQN